jgi:hypothetical protein
MEGVGFEHGHQFLEDFSQTEQLGTVWLEEKLFRIRHITARQSKGRWAGARLDSAATWDHFRQSDFSNITKKT